jgi:hypothetical protein
MRARRNQPALPPSIEWLPTSDDQNSANLASSPKANTYGPQALSECRRTLRLVSNRASGPKCLASQKGSNIRNLGPCHHFDRFTVIPPTYAIKEARARAPLWRQGLNCAPRVYADRFFSVRILSRSAMTQHEVEPKEKMRSSPARVWRD